MELMKNLRNCVRYETVMNNKKTEELELALARGQIIISSQNQLTHLTSQIKKMYKGMVQTFNLIFTVTAIREIWVEREDNRNFSMVTAKKYLRSYMNETWNLQTGNSLAVYWNGRIVDGQHRSWVMCQLPYPEPRRVQVAFGIAPKALGVDVGKKRTTDVSMQCTKSESAIYRAFLDASQGWSRQLVGDGELHFCRDRIGKYAKLVAEAGLNRKNLATADAKAGFVAYMCEHPEKVHVCMNYVREFQDYYNNPNRSISPAFDIFVKKCLNQNNLLYHRGTRPHTRNLKSPTGYRMFIMAYMCLDSPNATAIFEARRMDPKRMKLQKLAADITQNIMGMDSINDLVEEQTSA